MQIRDAQNLIDPYIPSRPFVKLMEKILGVSNLKIQAHALAALHAAAEAYLVSLFEDSFLCHINASWVMLSSPAMQLAWKVHGEIDFFHIDAGRCLYYKHQNWNQR